MNPLLAALVAAGVITQDEAERINRQQDPDAARLWAEQQLAAATQGGLSAQQARLADLLRTTNGNPSAAALDAFWRDEDARLWEAMRPTLEQVATENAIGAAVNLGAGDAMWNSINQQVIDWTAGYYTSADPAFVGSVPNLNQTARAQVADAFTRWNRGELNDGRRGGLPALITELERGGAFTPARAARIAITETTRIFSESEAAAADAVPELDGKRWDTARDELVCPVCLPLDRRVVGKNEAFAAGIALPPAHPSCRCGVTFVVREKAAEKDAGKPKQPPVQIPTAYKWGPIPPAAPQPAPVGAVQSATRKAESVIWYEANENAVVIDSATGGKVYAKEGERNSILFYDEEVALMRGNIVTHNHPSVRSAVSFSDLDVKMAAKYGIPEIRAVGQDYVYSLKLRDLEWDTIEEVYKVVDGLVADEGVKQLTSVAGYAQVEVEHAHRVWTVLEGIFGKEKFDYNRWTHSY